MPEGTTTRRKLQESPTARKLSQTRRIRKLRTSTGRLAMASTRHLRNSNADGRCGNAVRVAIETTVTDAEKKLNSAKNMKKVRLHPLRILLAELQTLSKMRLHRAWQLGDYRMIAALTRPKCLQCSTA